MKKSFAIFASAVLVAASFTSCGGKDSGKTTTVSAITELPSEKSTESESEADTSLDEAKINSSVQTEQAPLEPEKTGPVDDFDPKAEIILSEKNVAFIDPVRNAVDGEGKGINGNPDITSNTITYPKVFVVGWSYDSHLAYFTVTFQEGIGENCCSMFIQDMVEDKVVWNKTLNDADENTAYKDSEFIEALRKYKIHTEKKPSFESLPVIWNGNQVDFAMTSDVKGINDWGMKVQEYKVTATRKGMKTKTVDSDDGIEAEDLYLCGYIMNPYEERVALILGYTSYVFEGNGVNYKFIGCDLNKNF